MYRHRYFLIFPIKLTISTLSSTFRHWTKTRLKAEFRLLGSMTLDKVDSKDLACNRKLVNELAGQPNERLRLDASINNNRKRGENDK